MEPQAAPPTSPASAVRTDDQRIDVDLTDVRTILGQLAQGDAQVAQAVDLVVLRLADAAITQAHRAVQELLKK